MVKMISAIIKEFQTPSVGLILTTEICIIYNNNKSTELFDIYIQSQPITPQALNIQIKNAILSYANNLYLGANFTIPDIFLCGFV